VEDLIDHHTFETEFVDIAKGLPDLERIVSRVHAKNCKVKDFVKVLTVSLYQAPGETSHH
jgi:DNA mismatch repair protein MSH6